MDIWGGGGVDHPKWPKGGLTTPGGRRTGKSKKTSGDKDERS